MSDDHRSLLDRWLKSLTQIQSVNLVWLEGSLVNNAQPNPAADIDIRFGIADGAYDQLWKTDPTSLLSGLGEYLSLQGNWRLLTRSGIIVEIMAFRSSDLDSLELHDWEILFSRSPETTPAFTQSEHRPPGETWPHPEQLDRAKVEELTKMFLHYGATAAAPLHANEIQSARFSLEFMRRELMNLLFRRVGVWFYKRYKHLSEILPEEYLSDLDRTYELTSATEKDPGAIAAQTLTTLEMAGKHLQAMGDQIGGGFEPDWYQLMLSRTREQFGPFIASQA